MFCKNCGVKLDADANFCPACGTKVAQIGSIATAQTACVKIACPVNYKGWQVFVDNSCVAYDNETGTELGRCQQGETLIFDLDKPTTVKVVVNGCFGEIIELMQPGDCYKIGLGPFRRVYLAKVDAIV